MEPLKRIVIEWNEGIDAYMTYAQSDDPLLKSFFSVKEWEFIRHIFLPLANERSVAYEDKTIDFNENSVTLSDSTDESTLDKLEFFKIIVDLFDVMIVGANSDHHSVRYEPWWHEFTETAYQLRCKIELIV